MTTTHVFIVDTNTFKYHLEYLFAGTGAKDYYVDFNDKESTSLSNKREDLLVGMIADSQRVRKGDFIIFYLQQNYSEKVQEGKFYGIFNAKEDLSFLDNLCHVNTNINLSKKYENIKYPKEDVIFELKWINSFSHEIQMKSALIQSQERKLLGKFDPADQVKIAAFIRNFYANNQYLLENLIKSLTFRSLLEPFEVYPKGVTEWEALDEIKYIQSPHQMLWSLIYRKLKGNRGNTMITIYESERLFKLLRDKNNRQTLSGQKFTFDVQTQEIKQDNTTYNYTGRKEKINILSRLIKKYRDNKAFETHLQAYVVQNIGRGTNKELDKSLLNGLSFEWLGNEVSCGVGMQRIDVMLSLIKGNVRIVLPIELKSVKASTDNIIQIQRYIDWLEQYYVLNRISDIQPVLISKKITNKTSENYKRIIESFKQFNKKNSRSMPIKYIEYELEEDNLNFQEISY